MAKGARNIPESDEFTNRNAGLIAASLSTVIPFAATADAVTPLLLFLGRHSFRNVDENKRPQARQKPRSKFNPEGWALYRDDQTAKQSGHH